MDHQILGMEGVGVGGLTALPPGAAESGMRPGWLGYVSVDDVDESVANIVAAGGAAHVPAMDVPDVGRIAMVADPQGASLYVMTPKGDGPAASSAGPRRLARAAYQRLEGGPGVLSGTALMVEFSLAGQRFQALNGGPHFTHSEAISLSISARDAAEVDHYWDALTKNGGTESQCGWLKDPFGVSWQVVPDGLGELLCDPDPARQARAVEAMMKMKKLDLAALRAAADEARP